MDTPIINPVKQPETQPVSAGLNGGVVKELLKKVYVFPENYKLQGPENFDQWKQALTIIFKALGIITFIATPELGCNLTDAD